MVYMAFTFLVGQCFHLRPGPRILILSTPELGRSMHILSPSNLHSTCSLDVHVATKTI
jgi:hypothetical protein